MKLSFGIFVSAILLVMATPQTTMAFVLTNKICKVSQNTVLWLADRLLEQEVARALARQQGEQDTIARAQVEEEILTTSAASRTPLELPTSEELEAAKKANQKFWQQQQRLLSRNKKKQSGGGGMGFGGSANKKKKTQSVDTTKDNDSEPLKQIAFNPELDPEGYAAVIRTEGVVRKNNVLCQETIDSLRQFIDDELIRAQDDIASGKVSEPSRFARVLLKRNRWDMSLSIDDDIVMQALYELLGTESGEGTVGSIIESALSGDAQLHELASLISDPGSDRQILHPDMAHQGDIQTRTGPPFVTCFVAVQDVTDAAMGPTEFLPGTNTLKHHEEFEDAERRDDLLLRSPTQLALLQQGDCSLYDTSTLHAGSANRSTKRRRIFYCTFRSISLGDDRTVDEPGSIRGDVLERRWSLRDVRHALKEWHAKKDA